MHPDKINRLNGIGVMFRFITPALLAVMSTLIVFILSGIKTDILGIKFDIRELTLQFSNHLSDHKQIELTLEKRLTKLETLIHSIK